jgi:GNAT superfamily N-acetyltransferase
MPQIRHATPIDAASIAEVHVRSWRAGYRGLLPDALLDSLSPQARQQVWETWLAEPNPEFVAFVAEEEGAVVGFCSLLLTARDADLPHNTAEITALYVEPARWRHGIGKALLTHALQTAEAAGAEMVTLWILELNKSARAFYAGLGFIADGASKREQVGGASLAPPPCQVRLRAAVGG